jgi:acetyl-CoA carboxylase biotin carboxyl carrier protein
MNKEDEFTLLNKEEILEILKLVDESDFDELHLEMGGLKLVVGKHPGKNYGREPGATEVELGKSTQEAETRPAIAHEKEPEVYTSVQTETKRIGPDDSAYLEEEGLVAIKAPLLGTFYRSPKPGAPPFVEVGTHVTEDDTVCVIEVMKLFTAVKAGFKGRIAKICVENAQMVEYHQTLFLIEPEGSPEEPSEA